MLTWSICIFICLARPPSIVKRSSQQKPAAFAAAAAATSVGLPVVFGRLCSPTTDVQISAQLHRRTAQPFHGCALDRRADKRAAHESCNNSEATRLQGATFENVRRCQTTKTHCGSLGFVDSGTRRKLIRN